MTDNDILYFHLCAERGFVKTPFMEVGSAKVQGAVPNLCELARFHGVTETLGVDLEMNNGVTRVFDFGLSCDEFQQTWTHGLFSTVAVFNVLEHTFDPVTVLTNASSCLQSGGSMLVVTPCVWPLHNYPGDYVRLLPNWYETFAVKNRLCLEISMFCWLSQFGITKISTPESNNAYQLPNYLNSSRSSTPLQYWISRAVHKAFNTYGRSHIFPHAAIGAVFYKD